MTWFTFYRLSCLYTATVKRKTKKNQTSMSKETPLSEATIPSSLADIQKRCADLLDDDGEIKDLTLEDASELLGRDPYATQR